ncbi:O-antigen polymerase [Blautia sp.]|uniref:O-antigen polymerase n=1 Tax=Blautia sp. TaxID=1955243 RepID=UPI00257FA234|nr:O-antigen polymerase [Blautia sp.]MBS7173923.1 oligosaccharide repeat unit polymerase [Blautia sp.]
MKLMLEMHLIYIIFIYSVFTFWSLYGIINNVRKYHSITIMSLCKLMYIITLAIVPIITYGVYLRGNNVSTLSYDERDVWTLYVIAVYTVIAYIMFIFGYKIKQRQYQEKYGSNQSEIIVLITILMIISIVSLILWSSGFGGINQLLINANSVRAGFITSLGNKAFFKHFVPMAMIVSFLTFNYLFIDKADNSTQEKVYVWVSFLISIIISVLFILANDGRMLAGVYVGLFFLLVIKNDYEVKQKSLKSIVLKMLVLSALALVVIINADEIFRIMKGEKVIVAATTDSEKDIFSSIAYEFSFTLTGAQEAILSHARGYGNYTLWNDIVNGIFAWLPTSIKPVMLTDVWDYNTSLLNTGVYGQAPTSMIAQSIYDLGMFGILFIPCVYGVVVRKIEKILTSYKNNLFASTIYIVLGFYLAKGITYFSLYNIMMNVFFIVVACIVYKSLQKIRIGGSK